MMAHQYLMFEGLSFANTPFALIFPALFSAFSVFFLQNYFEVLPDRAAAEFFIIFIEA